MNFQDCERTLKGRQSKRLDNNTYLHAYGKDTFNIRLHDTVVVQVHRDGSYTLNSGGWRSKTTKDRINKYSPCSVYQKDYDWFIVDWNGHSDQFYDGVEVDRTGAPFTRYSERNKFNAESR